MDQQAALGTAAFVAGRSAGKQALSSELNPHEPGTADHLQWQQGHLAGAGDLSAYANQKSRREWWEDQKDSGWLYVGHTSSRGNL